MHPNNRAANLMKEGMVRGLNGRDLAIYQANIPQLNTVK